MNPSTLSTADVDALRARLYNAEVVRLVRLHEDLMIVEVRPDWGRLDFEPGQYTVLGLGSWEPRISGVQVESPPAANHDLIKRAYSISCPLLDEAGKLVRTSDRAELEFYIALVRAGPRPPALTPRLFALGSGERIYVGDRPHGHYTLGHLRPEQAAVFVATGTGEAPHNAMIAELLARGHAAPIVAVVWVRQRCDLGYLAAYQRLQRQFANFRYLPFTTREPENLDPALPGYVGKRYVQDYFASGNFERETGVSLAPGGVHVFLCGNPGMIGVPHHTHDPAGRYPRPTGMVEVLERRGLRIDRPHEPGEIHFEKYW